MPNTLSENKYNLRLSVVNINCLVSTTYKDSAVARRNGKREKSEIFWLDLQNRRNRQLSTSRIKDLIHSPDDHRSNIPSPPETNNDPSSEHSMARMMPEWPLWFW